MARSMTTVAFDEDEIDILKSINDSKRISALVKPLTDEIREMARSCSELARRSWVESNDLDREATRIERHRELVDKFPDSEAKEEHLAFLDRATEVIDNARTLG